MPNMQIFNLVSSGKRWGPCHLRCAVILGCALAGLVLLLGTPAAYGQATINAALSGSVLDGSGAAIPEAMVTLSDSSKGFTRTQTTQPDGIYSFTLIPAGTYTLRVEKEGFKTLVKGGITLIVGQAGNQDVVLQIGDTRQSVEVTAAAPIVNTSNATVGSEVTQRETVELPLNWRNVFGLVMLDSSVNRLPNNEAGAGGEITDQGIGYFDFGGGRSRNSSFLLDGHWNNTGDWGGIIYAPGVDETQEFKIVTHAFTAQYGWSMGNVLNAITKSGTSSFHGDVFEFLRNDNMDANNFFANKAGDPRPDFKRNNFGVSAGGPLYIPKIYEQKDKTFIFGYYEGLRQQSPYTQTVTVPTDAMKAGDFSGLLDTSTSIGTDQLGRPIYKGAIYNPFSSRPDGNGGFIRDAFGATAANGWKPTNMIPSAMFDGVAKNMLQYWPSPRFPGLSNNYVDTGSLPGWVDKYSVRVDHNISEKSRFFARWSWDRIYQQGTGDIFGKDNPGGPGSGNPNPRWDIGTNYTHMFSPTLVLSVTGGWNRWFEGFRPTTGNGFKTSSLGLPSFLDQVPFFPSIGIQDVYGLGAGYWSATPREPRTLMVDVTKVLGSHTFTMGYQNIWIQNYETFIDPVGFNFDRGMSNGPNPLNPVSGTGYGFASFLMGAGAGSGTPGQFTAAGAGGQFPLNADSAFMKKYRGLYFQDDWKVNRRTTLNLGLRWDMQTAPTDRFNRIWAYSRLAPSPLTGLVPDQYSGPDGKIYPLTLLGKLDPVGTSSAPFGRSVYNAPLNNWAPRIGLAHQLSDKLVARGGFGIFFTESHEVSSYQGLSLYGFSTLTPWVATVGGVTPYNLLSNPFPNGYIQPVGRADGELTMIGNSIDTFPPNTRKTPYVSQWTGSLQYQFTPNDVLDVTYVGNHGTGLTTGSITGNQLTPDKLALGDQLLQPVANPFYSYFNQHNIQSGCGLDQPTVPWRQLLRPAPQYCGTSWKYMPGAYSNYHGLTVNYRRSWKTGMHVLASFTWSVYRDNSTGPGFGFSPDRDRLAYDYSLNYNNIPKSFVLSYIYELPVGRGKRWGNQLNSIANGILGGWQLSGITTFKDGWPLAISGDDNVNNFNNSSRPNCTGNPSVANPTIDKWFNTDAFSAPPAYTFGNCPRTLGSIRAMGRNNWDINLAKDWKWQERFRIQFRGEFFNAFNHTYLLGPDTYLQSATFGQVSSAGTPRDIQLGLKVYW